MGSPKRIVEGDSVVLIPVPAADPAVARHRQRYDPSAARGIPAHVTILYPFLPLARLTSEVRTELGTILSAEPTFAFDLTALTTFGASKGDALYLTPHPEEPFARVTRRLVDRWPEAPPYGGLYARIIPHLTIAMLDGDIPQQALRREIEPHLPIRAEATDAWLMTRDARGTWNRMERFGLGAPAGQSPSPPPTSPRTTSP
ncbi:MAG: 2'-5' RNA ligase family protein [Hyphomicrobiales bacterium]